MQRRRVGWQMNWKWHESKQSLPNRRTILAIAWRDWGKPEETSVSIARIQQGNSQMQVYSVTAYTSLHDCVRNIVQYGFDCQPCILISWILISWMKTKIYFNPGVLVNIFLPIILDRLCHFLTAFTHVHYADNKMFRIVWPWILLTPCELNPSNKISASLFVRRRAHTTWIVSLLYEHTLSANKSQKPGFRRYSDSDETWAQTHPFVLSLGCGQKQTKHHRPATSKTTVPFRGLYMHLSRSVWSKREAILRYSVDIFYSLK
jgi:hypothetical protein